jgi:hypothetical protein
MAQLDDIKGLAAMMLDLAAADCISMVGYMFLHLKNKLRKAKSPRTNCK